MKKKTFGFINFQESGTFLISSGRVLFWTQRGFKYSVPGQVVPIESN